MYIAIEWALAAWKTTLYDSLQADIRFSAYTFIAEHSTKEGSLIRDFLRAESTKNIVPTGLYLADRSILWLHCYLSFRGIDIQSLGDGFSMPNKLIYLSVDESIRRDRITARLSGQGNVPIGLQLLYSTAYFDFELDFFSKYSGECLFLDGNSEMQTNVDRVYSYLTT
jgi:hypothetical protein